jgi:hypothetical protein
VLAASDRTGYLCYFLPVIFTTEDWDYLAAAANSKIFSRIKRKKQQQLDIVGSYCCNI